MKLPFPRLREILTRDGNKYTYTIASMDESPVPETEFSFDATKYPGIYIDDMTK